MFMTVIFEARHSSNDASTTITKNIIGPSAFYIDEISDTLDHLRTGGIENLANAWLQCNKRPEVSVCMGVCVCMHVKTFTDFTTFFL